jgi:hypothetical protein
MVMNDIQEQPIVQNVFKKELEWFDSDIIRRWVIDVFGQLCPGYFWYVPASIKNYHPPICRLRGGLVHHVKLAMRFAKDFALMWESEVDLESRDLIFAGVLLHDMLKHGDTENIYDTFVDHKEYNQGHGRYCAAQIMKLGFMQPWQQEIIKAVRFHMGQWTLDLLPAERFEQENNIVVKSVHLADYAASRSLHKWFAERYTDESMRYLY